MGKGEVGDASRHNNGGKGSCICITTRMLLIVSPSIIGGALNSSCPPLGQLVEVACFGYLRVEFQVLDLVLDIHRLCYVIQTVRAPWMVYLYVHA